MSFRSARPATRRPGTRKSRRPAGLSRRTLTVLSCAAAALCCAVSSQAVVTRQIPDQTFIRTEPVPRFLVFTYVPRAPDADKTPVIFYSGQWGWTPLQQDTASYLASTGRLVLGIDGVNYFSALITPNGMADDLARFRARANERAGRPKEAPVILAGFASGAEIIPFVLNRVGEPGVRGAVLVAPDANGGRVFRTADRLNMTHPAGEEFDVGDELRRMAPIPVALIEGSLDEESAAKALSAALRGPHVYVPIVGGDRKFQEVRDTFFETVSKSLLWIEGAIAPSAVTPAPPASPVPTVSAAPKPSPAPAATPAPMASPAPIQSPAPAPSPEPAGTPAIP